VHERYSITLFTILLLLAVATGSGFGQRGARPVAVPNAPPTLAAIVPRMEQAMENNRLHVRPYVMTREYRLYGSSDQPKSEVIAEVSYEPPNEKTYRIEKAEGIDRGKMIVEHILSSEAEATGKDSPAAFDHRNYDFSFGGEDVIDGSPCWVLRLIPKREETNLISGRAWVDKRTFLIRRVEGDMAKNPSWWVKRVDVTISFGNVSGMWLQTGTRAVADVRVVGRHVLVGEAVKVRTSEEVAFLGPGNRPENRKVRIMNRSRAASTALGAGVLAEH
jgi:hypothetical protein